MKLAAITDNASDSDAPNYGPAAETVRITQTGVKSSAAAIERLRAEYTETGSAILPGFLEPSLIGPVMKRLATANFEVVNEVAIRNGQIFGTTLKMSQAEPTLMTLHFILNNVELFRIMEKIAGCPELGNFTSRLHRTRAGTDQHIDWHDDDTQNRTLGLNINLSTEQYSGGVLQLRGPDKIIRGEIGQLAPGDAFLFKIADGWQHRLTPVESGERTVAVGWFRTQPNWHTLAIEGLRARTISFA